MGFNSGFKGLKRFRWAGHVARMGETRDAYRETDHMEDVGVDGG